MKRPAIIFIYIYIYTWQKFDSELLVSTCNPTKGEKKKFTCTLNSPNDVSNFECEVPSHKCTASRISFTGAEELSTLGTLEYEVIVEILEYTKNPLKITVTEINSSGEKQELATSIDLSVQYEPTELPRLECQTTTSKENNFQSTSTCSLHSSKSDVELQNINNDASNCKITKTSTNPEADGFLSKRTHTVTIEDLTKTCYSSCKASVQMQDPTSDQPVVHEFSHQSSCSGHSVDFSNHDDTARIITFLIKIPYDYLRVEFKSSKSHVEITSDTASYSSTQSKEQVQHVISYDITDLQSTDTTFEITYDVVQTSKKKTLNGKNGSPYTYNLLPDERLRLTCNPDTSPTNLQYNQKAYKCTGRSISEEITLESKDSSYNINPKTNTGAIDRNTFKHQEFQIIISPTTIKCNEEDEVEIYFTEKSIARKHTFRQTITCEIPTITPNTHDSKGRKITWTLSALYLFQITKITSNNNEIVVTETPEFTQPPGDPLKTLCEVSYESNDLSVEQINFQIDVEFRHSNAFQKTITTQNYQWIRNDDEKPTLKCKIHSSSTTKLEYYQREYICSARSLSNPMTVTTNLKDLDINPANHNGHYAKKIYYHNNFKFITSPHNILCLERKYNVFVFNEGTKGYTSAHYQTITCPEPEISVKSHSTANREITWDLTARYSFTINGIVSKKNDIVVTPNNVIITATKESRDDYHANYKIFYESINLSVDEIEFKNEISFTHSEKFKSKVETGSVTWTRNEDESPSLDCNLKETEVPVDIKKFVVSCNALTINANFQLELEPSKFVLEKNREKKRSYKGVFKWDKYEIVVEDTDVQCNVVQTMTLSYKDTGKTLSASIEKTVTCPEPTVICYGHDQIKRTLKCKFSIQYPVHEIKISSENSNVEMSPKKISENFLISNHVISYTVLNPLDDTKKFKIKLDFYHKINELLHTLRVEREFKLKKDEIPKFSCSTKDEQPISSTGTVTYMCYVRTKNPTIPITTNPNTYIIHPLLTTSTKVVHFYEDANYETSLTPIAMKCGHSEIVELSFTDNSVKYSSSVNHTTSCPVPTIICDKHDMVERTITCDFTIGYQFDDIKVSVNSERIFLNSNNIQFMSFNAGVLQNHKITYIITDRTTSSESFSINFQVFQGGDRVVHDKTIGFRYFVKADEISQITCQKSILSKKIKYESEIYDCMIVSHSSKVSLQTSNNEYTISPRLVQGNLHNGIYIHENLILTVTPNVVKCGKKTDVGVFFTEDEKNIEFVVTHTTVCPDPIISCNDHDLYKRELTCKIDIVFPFTAIELVLLTSPAIVAIRTATTVSYAEFIRITDHALKISYEIKDLKHSDHHFNIQFTVKQDEEVIALILKTFQYLLKLDEIPHISCDQKMQTQSVGFETMNYNCDIVSHNSFVNLVSDVDNYAITGDVRGTEKSQQVYKVSNKEISITGTDYSCIRPVPVKISLNDKDSVPQFTVIHKTSCPEPIIKCEKHDLNTRKITCLIKIDFKFKEIRISTSSSNIRLLNNLKVDANGQEKYNSDYEIDYEIINFRNKNHNLNLIFDIIQNNDDSVIFQMIRHFRYKLTRDENPYIKCTESPGDRTIKFYQSKFSCEIVSFIKEVALEVNLDTYKIDKHLSVGLDHNHLYKHSAVMIILEPKNFFCDHHEKVGIRFVDADDKNLVEYVSHTTKCPDPTFSKISENAGSRKIVMILEAHYEFQVIDVEPDKKSFTLSSEVGSIELKEQTWKGEISISYEPEDWSIDSQEFHLILKVGQGGEWKTTVLSQKFTCNLKSEEKPQISCELKTSQILEDFTQKVFTCNAITRQSVLIPSLSDENYKITSTKGTAQNLHSVYHWTGYEVVIQDIAITCNIDKTFSILFTEYSQNLKSIITMRTICPIPEFSLKTHDKFKRIIIYNVESKFPSYTTQINSRLRIASFTKIESSIMRIERRWKSTITITYTVKNLLNTDFNIQFSLLINQGTEKIGIVELPFEYELHDKEKRQISCETYQNLTSEIFAVTEYICYVVGKHSLSISVEPATYSLTHESTSSTSFVNIWKWENVSVRVEDKSIICNKTINLTLTNMDGKDDKYSTIVQHTTICERINGDCDILRKDRTYIFCNFTSNTKFTLRNFSCSESFNCTRSIDMEKSSEKWNEFVFELTPSSTDTLIEFDFNVTLQHSQFSPVPFSFILEYSTESKMIEEQKPSPAKIVTSFSHSIIYIAILAVLFTYVLIRRVKLSFNVYEHIEKPSFRNL